MNSHRRTFRGRAGPTDGRLPKHNARRRRRQPSDDTAPERQEKIYLDGKADCLKEPPLDERANVSLEKSSNDDNGDESVQGTEQQESADESSSARRQADETRNSENSEKSDPCAACTSSINSNNPVDGTSDEERAFRREVGHLTQRIRNNKSALQTANTLANPATYQTNVLRATQNCAIEWKSIVRQYPDLAKLPEPEDEPDLIAPLCKTTGLSLFELVQRSLQCGPLAGAKPGYFSRCGSDVAKVVLQFLEELSPAEENLLELHWSDKQVSAIQTWKKNAEKAVAKQKGASKSVQTKMTKAENRSKANRQLKQKKFAKKQALKIAS